MYFKVLAVVSAAVIGLINCNGGDGGTDAGPPIVFDAGPPDMCAPPDDGFGTSEGSNFFPFELMLCDGSNYSFYGETEGYCDTSYTVVSIGAGWCNPCRIEAGLMEEFLTQRYAEHNVRVVVAIIQNNDYEAPSLSFCEGWQEQYGLTNPVMIDPAQLTQVYFPAGSLPATLIVNSAGVIVHREYGVSSELRTVRAELDNLLGL